MNDPCLEMEYKGCKIKIYPDECDGSNDPREWENMSVFSFSHKRYNLPDESDIKIVNYDTVNDYLNDVRKEIGKKGILYKVWMYDHSGITISWTELEGRNPFAMDQQGWDSGIIGFAWVTEEKIKEEYGNLSKDSIDKAKQCLEAELYAYDDMLTGNVYGFVIEGMEGEMHDSCWGFFPDHDEDRKPMEDQHVVREAKATIDYYVEEQEKAKQLVERHYAL